MPQGTSRSFKTGGNLCRLADFVALSLKMHKLVHPARPDVDWRRVETLCLNLLQQTCRLHVPGSPFLTMLALCSLLAWGYRVLNNHPELGPSLPMLAVPLSAK